MNKGNILTAVCSLIFMSFLACSNNNNGYEPPQGLRKLTEIEMLEYLRQGKLSLNEGNVVIRDSLGNKIGFQKARSYNPNAYFAEYYVNENGVIKEVLFRPIRKSDRRIINEMEKIMLERVKN